MYIRQCNRFVLLIAVIFGIVDTNCDHTQNINNSKIKSPRKLLVNYGDWKISSKKLHDGISSIAVGTYEDSIFLIGIISLHIINIYHMCTCT